MEIITGYKGEPHITSQQLRNTYIGIFGQTPRIIKGVGAELAATIISANEIDIADGMVSCQGCTAEVPRGTTESMVIENGSQGMLRKDLIVVRYTKNAGTAVESMELAVIKGTPVSSNPQRPSHTTGSIAEGDTTVDFPLYDVNIDGISITSVTRIMELVSVPNWINILTGQVATAQTDIRNLQNTDTTMMGFISAVEAKSIRATLYSFGSQTFDSTGAIDVTKNVSNSIPTGYTMIDVHIRSSGTYAAYFYRCEMTDSTHVHIQLFRPTYASVTATIPTVTLICVRNL